MARIFGDEVAVGLEEELRHVTEDAGRNGSISGKKAVQVEESERSSDPEK
jgi:hypothetical protein